MHERGIQIHRFGITRKKTITPHPENYPFIFIVVAWMGIFLRKTNMTTLSYKLFIYKKLSCLFNILFLF